MTDPVFDPMQSEEFRLMAFNCETDPSDRSRFFPVADWLREHGDFDYADAWEWAGNHYQIEFIVDRDGLPFWEMRFVGDQEDRINFNPAITSSLSVFVRSAIGLSKNVAPEEKATLAMMIKIIQVRLKQMRDTLNPKDSK